MGFGASYRATHGGRARRLLDWAAGPISAGVCRPLLQRESGVAAMVRVAGRLCGARVERQACRATVQEEAPVLCGRKGVQIG